MASSLEGKQLLETMTWVGVYFKLGGLESIMPHNNAGGQKVWM